MNLSEFCFWITAGASVQIINSGPHMELNKWQKKQ